MKAETLAIDLIRIDAGTQARIKIHEDTVEDYAELISQQSEWIMGPVDVFHDGTDYYLADGFHRTLAAIRVGRASLPCRIHKGTAVDARVFGMTANDTHGLRMSRDDKRCCVVWLIENGGKLTQTEIAEKAGVSRRWVQKLITERKEASSAQASTEQKSPTDTVQTLSISGQKAHGALFQSPENTEHHTEQTEQNDEQSDDDEIPFDDVPETEPEPQKGEQAPLIRNMIHQHVGKVVRLLDDLNGVKPNRPALNANLKACEGINPW